MSKSERYKFSIPCPWKGNLNKKTPKLAMVVLVNRLAQKICRKCYKRLPLNATICRSCKNSDLRKKKEIIYNKKIILDKNSKKRTIDKRRTNNEISLNN